MAAPAALQLVLSNLSEALVYTEPTCTEVNRKLWNQYAQKWDSKDQASWLTKMAENIG